MDGGMHCGIRAFEACDFRLAQVRQQLDRLDVPVGDLASVSVGWTGCPVHTAPRKPGSTPSNCRHESRATPSNSAMGTARRLVAEMS